MIKNICSRYKRIRGLSSWLVSNPQATDCLWKPPSAYLILPVNNKKCNVFIKEIRGKQMKKYIRSIEVVINKYEKTTWIIVEMLKMVLAFTIPIFQQAIINLILQ